MNAPAPGEFVCKRCIKPKPVAQEVVTRFRTSICRYCWGRKISAGHRSEIPLISSRGTDNREGRINDA